MSLFDPFKKKRAKDEISRLKRDLEERCKELECLYEIDRVSCIVDIPLSEKIERIAVCLPQAWQYSEIACCRIFYGDEEFGRKDCAQAGDTQQADLVIDGEKVGGVSVGYLETRPRAAEGPFLAEERKLLDSIALRLSGIIRQERTRIELGKRLSELERFTKVVMGREDRIIELKKEAAELKKKPDKE